jgi:hypothetical protein
LFVAGVKAEGLQVGQGELVEAEDGADGMED